jgi:hypothetical protein
MDKDTEKAPQENMPAVENIKKDNLHKSIGGLNLIAPRLEEQEEQAEKKFKLDIRVVLFLLLIVVISLGIVGYNWYMTVNLNAEKNKLQQLENALNDERYKITSNDQILERYAFYRKAQEGFISSKEVLTFWQDISENLGQINSIKLTNGVNFEINGRAENLRDVTKLWHFLSIDSRVNTVTLQGVSIPTQEREDFGLTFSFKGVLNLEFFVESE